VECRLISFEAKAPQPNRPIRDKRLAAMSACRSEKVRTRSGDARPEKDRLS
jgi:hypothetical protein